MNFTDIKLQCSQRRIFFIEYYLNIQTMLSGNVNFTPVLLAYLNNVCEKIFYTLVI